MILGCQWTNLMLFFYVLLRFRFRKINIVEFFFCFAFFFNLVLAIRLIALIHAIWIKRTVACLIPFLGRL